MLFLHFALLLAWRPALRIAPPAVPRGELTFILPPKPAAAVPLPRSVAPAHPLPQAQRRREPQAITVPAAPIAAPAPATVADPFAAPPDKSLGEMARGSVSDTLKALRKETPQAFLRAEQSGSAIARALAKAGGRTAGGTELEEAVLPDGRRMTRVRAGGSSYCVVMDSPGGSAGRDVFRDGPKARTVTCPN